MSWGLTGNLQAVSSVACSECIQSASRSEDSHPDDWEELGNTRNHTDKQFEQLNSLEQLGQTALASLNDDAKSVGLF